MSSPAWLRLKFARMKSMRPIRLAPVEPSLRLLMGVRQAGRQSMSADGDHRCLDRASRDSSPLPDRADAIQVSFSRSRARRLINSPDTGWFQEKAVVTQVIADRTFLWARRCRVSIEGKL
ncbi:MAG: hypothetical protein CMN72_13555 [Sphingomonas sp.]|nr:hypothetical protein [Sphingomonas sp.]